MDIYDFFLNKAKRDLWRKPHEDNQVFFRLSRLTRKGGSLGVVRSPVGNFSLPNKTSLFHLYETGPVSRDRLAITASLTGWTQMSTLMVNEDMLITVSNKGRMSTPSSTWLIRNNDGSILIAVDLTSDRIGFGNEDRTVIRFYSNAMRSLPGPAPMTEGSVVVDNNNIGPLLTFINESTSLSDSGIVVMYFLNGLMLRDGPVNHNSFADGDHLRYIADSTITGVSDSPLDSHDTFVSGLDSSRKIIFSSGEVNGGYIDDADVFISGIRKTDNRRVGLYYPRSSYSFSRPLTGQDWSLDITALLERVSILEEFIDVTDIEDVQVTMYHRSNAAVTVTASDSNRVSILNSLPESNKLSYLNGINSTVNFWRSDILEASPLNTWKGLTWRNTEATLLKGIYSRDAAVKALESVYYDNGQWNTPAGASNGGGFLLGYPSGLLTLTDYDLQNHSNEPYAGTGTELYFPTMYSVDPFDTLVGADTFSPSVVENGFGIHCFMEGETGLRDCVLGVDYYLEEGETSTEIVWTENTWGNDRWFRLSQRLIRIESIVNTADVVSGIPIANGRDVKPELPFRFLYVWLDGKFMIRGLDYVVTNNVIYFHSNWTGLSAGLSLLVLAGGFSKDGLGTLEDDTWGWIKENSLSTPVKYKVRTEYENLLFVDGVAETIDDTSIISILENTTTYVDGRPFAVIPKPQYVRDSELDVFCMPAVLEGDTDAIVLEVLESRYPIAARTEVSSVPSRYDLVSIFMDRVVKDVINGSLVIPSGDLTAGKLQELTLRYKKLLSLDATSLNHDEGYVVIRPMWEPATASVSAREYNFLTRIAKIFLGGRLSALNDFITIT